MKTLANAFAPCLKSLAAPRISSGTLSIADVHALQKTAQPSTVLFTILMTSSVNVSVLLQSLHVFPLNTLTTSHAHACVLHPMNALKTNTGTQESANASQTQPAFALLVISLTLTPADANASHNSANLASSGTPLSARAITNTEMIAVKEDSSTLLLAHADASTLSQLTNQQLTST